MTTDADDPQPAKVTTRIQIVELIVLSIVALATAWSGFQATAWGGRQALLYGQASSTRFQADAASTYAGQELAADASMFTAWLQAADAGDAQLQQRLEQRFTPDYAAAFHAWLRTDPLHDPTAPAGPALMPQYRNPSAEQAASLNEQASALFSEGTDARETANEYARNAILFATVLFLVAVAQRFGDVRIRIAADTVAILLLLVTLSSVGTSPRVW